MSTRMPDREGPTSTAFPAFRIKRVPLFIRRPTLAWARAASSLIPSPQKITVLFAALHQLFDVLLLLQWRTSSFDIFVGNSKFCGDLFDRTSFVTRCRSKLTRRYHMPWLEWDKPEASSPDARSHDHHRAEHQRMQKPQSCRSFFIFFFKFCILESSIRMSCVEWSQLISGIVDLWVSYLKKNQLYSQFQLILEKAYLDN